MDDKKQKIVEPRKLGESFQKTLSQTSSMYDDVITEKQRREYDEKYLAERRITSFKEINFSKRHADAKIDIDESPESWRKSCLYIAEKQEKAYCLHS